jgi:hypothetical protein
MGEQRHPSAAGYALPDSTRPFGKEGGHAAVYSLQQQVNEKEP